MKYLIVNADDYGLAPAVSAGIRQAHLHGIVTSTTVMINMPDARRALELAASDCPRLGLGVHLNLTAGRPLLPPDALPHLLSLAADGARFPNQLALRAHRHALSRAEIEAEWRAQIAQFVQWTGRSPGHLDSHHHTSYLTRALFETMLALAAEFDCAVRLPFPAPHATDPVALPSEWPAKLSPWAVARQAQTRAPDRFLGDFYDQQATFDHLSALLDRLPAGFSELMVHPALADDALAQISNYHLRRAQELFLLAHPLIAQRIAANAIRLVTFAQLPG